MFYPFSGCLNLTGSLKRLIPTLLYFRLPSLPNLQPLARWRLVNILATLQAQLNAPFGDEPPLHFDFSFATPLRYAGSFIHQQSPNKRQPENAQT
ncbi:hypothetical protein, partial [Kingella oralis]|uniref:hypothetical protein n=1 Tax=Kingella oralis TaxID=505 RepID=UPI003C6F30F5